MSLEKLQMLLRGGLWFARLDQFKTPYESSLPEANRLGLLQMLSDDDVLWLLEQYSLARDIRHFASCWFLGDGEPPDQLWKEFDRGQNGVAVRTKVGLLCDELAKTCRVSERGDGPIHMSRISYIDHAKHRIAGFNLLDAAFCVRERWAYQSELRLLVSTHGTAGFEGLYGKDGLFGPLVKPVLGHESTSGVTELVGGHADGAAIVFRVDPVSLVEEIAVRPGTTIGAYRQACAIAHCYGFIDRVRASGARQRAFRACARMCRCSSRRDRRETSD